MYCCSGDIFGNEGDLVLPPSGDSCNCCCSLARALLEARPFHFFTYQKISVLTTPSYYYYIEYLTVLLPSGDSLNYCCCSLAGPAL
jgi:hypothetical protein